MAAGITTYLNGAGAGRYPLVVATRDWHAPWPDTNDGHFASGGEPDYVTTWPVHCVAHTTGAAYHPDLVLPVGVVHVVKGEGRQDYSGFSGRVVTDRPDQPDTLAAVLRAHQIEQVDIVGIATDHCVAATALDAVQGGFAVRVLTDLTAAVAAETTVTALTKLAQAGVELTTTQEV